jgi:threonyl-tRNA synthetase
VKIDKRSEKIGAKIRDAELMKIPIMLIVGEKEVELKTVSVRRRHAGDLGTQDYDAFSNELKLEIKERKRGKSNSQK